MKEIDLEKILKSYVTPEVLRLNKPDYTFNMILCAMKEACMQTLKLAAENAKSYYIGGDALKDKFYTAVDRKSILDVINKIE
jgi:hypothetical protein